MHGNHMYGNHMPMLLNPDKVVHVKKGHEEVAVLMAMGLMFSGLPAFSVMVLYSFLRCLWG